METSDSQNRNQYLTVQDVAKMLKISGSSVARKFENVPCVVNIGPESFGKRKRNRTLRIVSNRDYGVTWSAGNAPLIEIGAITAEQPWMKTIEPSSSFYSYVMNNYWHTNYKADQEGW